MNEQKHVAQDAPRLCRDCGIKRARTGGTQCAACYARAYRNDPLKGAERRAKNRVSVRLWEKRHPDKRRRYVRNYHIRIGRIVPDLRELRQAVKLLEYNLSTAEKRTRVRSLDQSDRARRADAQD